MPGDSSESIGGHNPSEPASPRAASPSLITIPLNETHRVEAFECPRFPDVEMFLREDARSYVEHRLGDVFVLPAESDPTKIDGYYNFAASSLRRIDTSAATQADLPGDVPIPVFIIGWIGRDRSTYSGLGTELIVDAAKRGRSLGRLSWGLVLYAANRGLIRYYESLHFVPAQKTIKQLKRENEAGTEGENYYMYAQYEDLIIEP